MLESISHSNEENYENEVLPQVTHRTRWITPHPQEQSDQPYRPLVSLLVPAYNEALIIADNLAVICHYMETLESQYRWEVVIVNDGSRDDTGDRAEAFAKTCPNVRVVHHAINAGLGQALKTGFEECQGDYIITLDLDLSYSPDDHIERLLTKIRETGAKVVVASPYMKGGKVANVPWLRRVLSVWANRMLSSAAKRNLATLTGMVRVYDAEFVKSLNFRATGMDFNPEVIHKASLLKARVAEIPAYLRWHPQKAQPKAKRRKSSMKILRHTWAIVFYGFLFRPVMFFLIPSLLFFLLSCYANGWALIHCLRSYQHLAQTTQIPDPSDAVAIAFQQAPHTFFIGGIALVLSIQLFSLGILAVQSKSYFEEIFYLGNSIYKSTRKQARDKP